MRNDRTLEGIGLWGGGGGIGRVVKFKTPISVHYAWARRNHIYVLTPAVGDAAASDAAGRRVRSGIGARRARGSMASKSS